MLRILSFLYFCGSIATCVADGDPETLVCVRSEQGTVNNALRGPPGNPGLPGLSGLPGLPGIDGRPGLDGTVDYDRLVILIEEKVAQAILALENTEPKLKPSKFRCSNLDNKVSYDGKCYWAILPQNEVKFLAAEQLCLAKGAKPANIYSEQHFQKVMAYLREMNQDFFYIYTGMQFNPETGELSNYDGTSAQFSQWRHGDPVHRVADPVEMTRVAINVHSGQDIDDGMLTSAMIWPKKGVLCEA